MKICSILSILVSFTSCFSPTTHRTLSQPHKMTMLDEQALDEKLLRIAKSVKMEIFDLDEVMYGLESKDSRYGLEVVKTDVQLGQDGSLGLVLTEMAGNDDGRGLVLVREVTSAATEEAGVQAGDIISGVFAGHDFGERTCGLNYDRTVDAIGRAKEAAKDGILRLELDRLVERARVTVTVEDEDREELQTIETLAGENLRRLLIRKGLKLYDGRTKRFDMPFTTGDCAGEGICGTCLVTVKEGMECLNEPNEHEKTILHGRPPQWRAACRAIVGYDNKPANLHIQLRPESKFADELDPGVRKILKP